MRRLRPLLLPVLAFALAAVPASAQYVPYYGKNKVVYDAFEWRVQKTPHFDIHYYAAGEARLGEIAAIADNLFLPKSVTDWMERHRRS